MGISGEQVIPLNADHRSMCRFDRRNKEYLTVLKEIRRLAREAKTDRSSANMCMSLHLNMLLPS
jgi:hypothetical protein